MAVSMDTLCIVLGHAVCQLSLMSLAPGFPAAFVFSPSVRAQSVRSLAAMSNCTLISLDQSQERFLTISVLKIHLSPDVDHPSTDVVVSH